MRRSGWPVTFSIGLAVFNEPPHNVDVILDRADQLMYEAKQNGKNRIVQRVLGELEALGVSSGPHHFRRRAGDERTSSDDENLHY